MDPEEQNQQESIHLLAWGYFTLLFFEKSLCCWEVWRAIKQDARVSEDTNKCVYVYKLTISGQPTNRLEEVEDYYLFINANISRDTPLKPFLGFWSREKKKKKERCEYYSAIENIDL